MPWLFPPFSLLWFVNWPHSKHYDDIPFHLRCIYWSPIQSAESTFAWTWPPATLWNLSLAGFFPLTTMGQVLQLFLSRDRVAQRARFVLLWLFLFPQQEPTSLSLLAISNEGHENSKDRILSHRSISDHSNLSKQAKARAKTSFHFGKGIQVFSGAVGNKIHRLAGGPFQDMARSFFLLIRLRFFLFLATGRVQRAQS